MKSSGIIQKFEVMVNPAIFGYEKECTLIIKQIGKEITDDELLNRCNLLGDVEIFAKFLGGDCVIVLATRTGAEDKIRLLINLLRPAVIEVNSMEYKSVSMKVDDIDLKIIRSLLSNTRNWIAEIEKQASVSTRSIRRRIEKMYQKHVILGFTIVADMSPMALVGYIEFMVLINIQKQLYEYIFRIIRHELQEYLIFISDSNQIFKSQDSKIEAIITVFCCPNIPSVDLVMTKIAAYKGVENSELFITTKITFYQDWIAKEIDKRLRVDIGR